MLISKLHMYLPCKRGQIRSRIWNDLEGGVRVRDTSIRIYSTLKSDSGKSFVLIKPYLGQWTCLFLSSLAASSLDLSKSSLLASSSFSPRTASSCLSNWARYLHTQFLASFQFILALNICSRRSGIGNPRPNITRLYCYYSTTSIKKM
jgi:hypothetical protein